MQKYDLVVLPGRFEPLHHGHITNANEAAKIGKNILFLLGSVNQPRTIKNPFSYNERKLFIDQVFPQSNFNTVGVEDNLYSDTMWAKSVREAVNNHIKTNANFANIKNPKIAILGHLKDESSYYLKIFPTWEFVSVPGYSKDSTKVLDATKIRQLMFEGNLGYIESVVHPTTYNLILEFSKTEDYQNLVAEYNFIRSYKDAWKSAPYAPTFNTVDAVVVQSDNILLVKRKSLPGRGLWALPGGFLEQNETNAQGCLRELSQETLIKVPKRTLEQIISTCYQRCFDHPSRSLRGRTITQAFLIQLSGETLPKVKGADDAEIAKFFSFSELENMQSIMFEDHFSIANEMISKIDSQR